LALEVIGEPRRSLDKRDRIAEKVVRDEHPEAYAPARHVPTLRKEPDATTMTHWLAATCVGGELQGQGNRFKPGAGPRL
jgi:hypothetical protein